MALTHLAYDSPIEAYEIQADALLGAWKAGDAAAIDIVRHNLPKLLNETVVWLPKRLSDEELRATPVALDDARLALARWYAFKDWPALADYVAAVGEAGSPTQIFESAVEAVINGDAAGLGAMLKAAPDLVRARSARVTHYDPPQTRATLLHYVAANGVEGYRQKSPAAAVDIARLLLTAGAEADALAGSYGGQHTTMSMLVSSEHPKRAGVQVPLVHTLVDFGASVEGRGEGSWTAPLLVALVFGYLPAAEALAERGARVDTLAKAAGLGRIETVRALLPSADAGERHRALALATLLGQVDAVRLLLDAGEDPNRFNPPNMHAHGTPLHHAAARGDEAVVRLLVERGARLDVKDTLWEATPLGWADYCGQPAVAAYLRERGSA